MREQERIENYTGEELVKESNMEQTVVGSEDYKKEKFIALFQARKILSKHGTMEERRICSKQLLRMKKLGAKAV
jgi:hypothetical protein